METNEAAVMDADESEILPAEGPDNDNGDDTEPDEASNIVTTSKTIDGTKHEVSVEVNRGATVDEAVDMYGADTVYDLYRRAFDVKLQAGVRNRIKQLVESGVTGEELDSAIQAEFGDWRPDVDRTPTRDPRTTVKTNWNKLSLEERQALYEELKADFEGEE